ncbi:MAG: hypothetical protein HOP29_05030 [Phycisphaerales bacterium]|nr:hypothetical protein [Phycisphaerales bacterium]
MILNTWSITSVFLAGVGILLSLAIIVVSTVGRFVSVRGVCDPGRDEPADRVHLLVLLVSVLTGVRLIAWPHFYWLLKSLVAGLSSLGVMCAYGVARLNPFLVTPIHLLKPAALTALGFALVASRSRPSATDRGSLWRGSMPAIVAAVLVIAECTLEGVYVFREKSGQQITCCTQFIDTRSADAAILSVSPALRELSAGSTGIVAWTAGTLAMIAATAGLARANARDRWVTRIWIPGALSLLGAGNLFLTGRVWSDTVAPRVLQLPYHHCVYELITDVPAMTLAALVAVAGHACLLWPVGLQLLRGSASPAVASEQGPIYGFCALALATELLIVIVHLV